MKHIVPFDVTKKGYKVGDYIEYGITYVNNNQKAYKLRPGKIIAYNPYITSPYIIETEADNQITLLEPSIKRLLTPEEIEEFQINKETKKYNL